MNFDDIDLISHHISDIKSRDDIDINTVFCGSNLINPIISSPMKDVTNGLVSHIMYNSGGFGIIHRFQSIEDQVKEYIKFKNCGCAIGINDNIERFYELYNVGCRVFCIDTANGASTIIAEFIDKYLSNSLYKDLHLIVGNICSVTGFDFLSKLKNVSAIRCGVANGNVCTTKLATGIYTPILKLIEDCYCYKKHNNISTSIIADGGIRSPADFCKSIIFGADAIMLGSVIASTIDSPAETVEINGQKFKQMRGSASFDIQKFYKNEPKYIEGETKLIPLNNLCLFDLLNYFNNGLRSSMSYFNAKNLDEYRNNLGYIC